MLLRGCAQVLIEIDCLYFLKIHSSSTELLCGPPCNRQSVLCSWHLTCLVSLIPLIQILILTPPHWTTDPYPLTWSFLCLLAWSSFSFFWYPHDCFLRNHLRTLWSFSFSKFPWLALTFAFALTFLDSIDFHFVIIDVELVESAIFLKRIIVEIVDEQRMDWGHELDSLMLMPKAWATLPFCKLKRKSDYSSRQWCSRHWEPQTLRWAPSHDDIAEGCPLICLSSIQPASWSSWENCLNESLLNLRVDGPLDARYPDWWLRQSASEVRMILMTMTLGSPVVAWRRVHLSKNSALGRVDFFCSPLSLSFEISCVRLLTSSARFSVWALSLSLPSISSSSLCLTMRSLLLIGMVWTCDSQWLPRMSWSFWSFHRMVSRRQVRAVTAILNWTFDHELMCSHLGHG